MISACSKGLRTGKRFEVRPVSFAASSRASYRRPPGLVDLGFQSRIFWQLPLGASSAPNGQGPRLASHGGLVIPLEQMEHEGAKSPLQFIILLHADVIDLVRDPCGVDFRVPAVAQLGLTAGPGIEISLSRDGPLRLVTDRAVDHPLVAFDERSAEALSARPFAGLPSRRNVEPALDSGSRERAIKPGRHML